MPDRAKPKTAKQRAGIVALQNEIRNAINFSLGDPYSKSGVAAEDLKKAMRDRHIDVSSIVLRAQRLQAGSPLDLEADYKLWLDGELLFRLKLVEWDGPTSGTRWHVKRHPEATWWRSPKPPRKSGKASNAAR